MTPPSRTVSDSSGEMWVIKGFSSERVPSTNIPLVESSPVISLDTLVSTERTIQQAVNHFMDSQNVHTKLQLDDWCAVRGIGRKSLYDYVKEISPIHWDNLKDARAGIRGYYESKLVGYKHYKQ